MKKVIFLILQGIVWGCTICVLIILTCIAVNGENYFQISAKEFITQIVCGMSVGIGFILPSIIYKNKRMAMWLKILIQMSIGFAVYFIAASYAGWIFTEKRKTITSIVLSVIIAFASWIGFYLFKKPAASGFDESISGDKNK